MSIQEIVERIGIIRTRANLSARALSLTIGKNASYIHLLESEKTTFEPSLSVLLDIIEYVVALLKNSFIPTLTAINKTNKHLTFLKPCHLTKKRQ